MREGFVAEAEALALAVRSEIGLEADDHLDCEVLAEEWGVPVVALDALLAAGARPSSIHHLTVASPSAFSAGTVVSGTRRLIVVNPAHPAGRRANSLAHELAHLLLEHEPGSATGPGGCRVWDGGMEDEADRLAGALLVPREAAVACARVGLPLRVGAARFGVSVSLMRQRTHQSGAARQAYSSAPDRDWRQAMLNGLRAGRILDERDLSVLAELDATQWRDLLERCRAPIRRGDLRMLMDVLVDRAGVPAF
jgi:Zn-dependent peptidase ImmA (M78 family)